MNKIDYTKPLETTKGAAARLLASDIKGEYQYAVAFKAGSEELVVRFSDSGRSSGGRNQLRNKVVAVPLKDLYQGQRGRIVSSRFVGWAGAVVMGIDVGDAQAVTVAKSPQDCPELGTCWYDYDGAMVEVLPD